RPRMIAGWRTRAIPGDRRLADEEGGGIRMRRMSLGRQVGGALFGLLSFVTVMAAEPTQGAPPSAHRAPGGGPDDGVRQAMEQMVVARMTEALRLSEDQKANVIPRVQELMRARRDHAVKRRAALARLRGL